MKSISQLVAYVRFVKENAIVDEFLFCQEMKERTRAKHVFDFVNAFPCENSIAWNKVGSVYGMHRWCANYDRASIRFCCPIETSCSAYGIKSLYYS